MIVDILERYQIDVPDRMANNFAKYAMIKKTRFRKECLCFDRLVGTISDVTDVVEICGGIGRCSVILRGNHELIKHDIWEIDPECVEHLGRLSAGWVGCKIHEGDAFKRARGTAGLLSCDFYQFNINRMVRGAPERDALDRLLRSGPRWLHMTDTGVHLLHLHRELYSKLSERVITDHDSYLEALSALALDRWGYSISHAWTYSGSMSYLLLQMGNFALRSERV